MIKYILFISIIVYLVPPCIADLDATQLVKKAVKNMQGTTYTCHKVKLIIVRPGKKIIRTMLVHYGGKKYTLVHIIKPVRDKNTTILKRNNSLWIYSPKIRKIMRVPFVDMKESVFDSDFDYNDIVKSSTMGDDYIHKIVGISKIFRTYGKVYVIEMFTEHDICGTYAKLRAWVRKKDTSFFYIQYYNYSNSKLKIDRILKYSQFKTIDNRYISTKWTMYNNNKKGYYTIYKIEDAMYNDNNLNHIFKLRTLKNPPKDPFIVNKKSK